MSKQEEGKTDRRVSTTASMGLQELVLVDRLGFSLHLDLLYYFVLCRLQELQKDIEAAERNEDHHLQVLKESETLLQAKRAELEKLKSQV